jgi:hypothetical protein
MEKKEGPDSIPRLELWPRVGLLWGLLVGSVAALSMGTVWLGVTRGWSATVVDLSMILTLFLVVWGMLEGATDSYRRVRARLAELEDRERPRDLYTGSVNGRELYTDGD